MRRAALLVAALAAALAAPGVARAAEQTFVFRSGPITIAPYFTAEGQAEADSPNVDGYVTGVEARIVDAAGNPLDYRTVMLHHVALANVFRPDTICKNYRDYAGRVYPYSPERFFAVGEEGHAVRLPPGYGYPNKASDTWGLVYMLMNHLPRRLTAYVEYRVRYVTDEQLTPVKPLWLDLENCRADPVFDVPGTGGRGSTFTRSVSFRVPESGVLVAGGGHLHGGGISLTLSSKTCNRTLFESLPSWERVEPRPLLHEGGPSRMSSFVSPTGIPVSAGDVLKLAATYDNSLPHTRVMGIMLTWLAPRLTSPCAPPGALQIELGRPTKPPLHRLPLPAAPKGAARRVTSTWVGDYKFGTRVVRLRPGQRFTWRFVGSELHNITLANGPIGFSSPNVLNGRWSYRFVRKGRYELFCALHPVAMSQVITVG
jgi:plastocyanin